MYVFSEYKNIKKEKLYESRNEDKCDFIYLFM